jgi:hypothetical protein
VLSDTDGVEVILKQQRAGHTVFHYLFHGERGAGPTQSALERGVYDRGKMTLRVDRLEYDLRTAYGLPEFDSLSYDSDMLIKALSKMTNHKLNTAVIGNPGQGHIPVVLWKLFRPGKINLTDRDLLALRYAQNNLINNDCPAERITLCHEVGAGLETGEKIDFFGGVLRDEGREATLSLLDQAAAKMGRGGIIILAGGSTAITRLADCTLSRRDLRINGRERRRGYSLLVMEKT